MKTYGSLRNPLLSSCTIWGPQWPCDAEPITHVRKKAEQGLESRSPDPQETLTPYYPQVLKVNLLVYL